MTQPQPRRGTPENPSDAVLTIPNLITFIRLALMPMFVWLGLGRRAALPAFLLGLALGVTDWIDGHVARRLAQVSRLGITIDPLFDRVLVAAAAVVLIGLDLSPWPAVAVVLGRDTLLVAAAPLLSARGIDRPPVSRIGKYGSAGTMLVFGLFLASGIDPSARHLLRSLAWIGYVPAVALSYAAAGGYARTVVTALRSGGDRRKRAGPG